MHPSGKDRGSRSRPSALQYCEEIKIWVFFFDGRSAIRFRETSAREIKQRKCVEEQTSNQFSRSRALYSPLNGPEKTCRGRSACSSHHPEYGFGMRGGKVPVMKGVPQRTAMGTLEFSMAEVGRGDVIPRTRRTTGFLMLYGFWEHKSLKYTSESGEEAFCCSMS